VVVRVRLRPWFRRARIEQVADRLRRLGCEAHQIELHIARLTAIRWAVSQYTRLCQSF
jgi:hypothetical protein